MRVSLWPACLLFLLSGLGAQLSPSSGLPAFLYTAAQRYEPLAWIQGKDRFPRGATIFIQDATGRRPLAPDFRASADPVVSFDASRVLFAGKRQTHDHWQIWEISLSAGKVRKVTSCAGDCIRPLYLPDDRFVFAEQVRGETVIRIAALAGGQSLALTYNPGNSLPSDILRDGRILFDAAFPLQPGRSPDIYTVYSDGSGVESYRCDHGRARHSGRQLISGDIVFASAPGVARFTSALAHQVTVSLPSQDNTGEIAELSDGDWLVASRSKPKARFEISRWTPGAQAMQAIASDEHADVVQPTLLRPRPVPNRHPTGLHDWNYANLLCLSAYTSRTPFSAGAVASVRLYTRGPSGHETLLGTATVERDGSFYLRTPGDQPLKLELLDHAGKSVQKEQGWFWLRRGEQRICVGCHAGPETAPENAVPAVLLRSTVAADMTGTTTHTASGGH
jgi:hydrazine synthase alpha subunit-like protein